MYVHIVCAEELRRLNDRLTVSKSEMMLLDNFNLHAPIEEQNLHCVHT